MKQQFQSCLSPAERKRKDPAVKGKVHCDFTLKQKTKRNP